MNIYVYFKELAKNIFHALKYVFMSKNPNKHYMQDGRDNQ